MPKNIVCDAKVQNYIIDASNLFDIRFLYYRIGRAAQNRGNALTQVLNQASCKDQQHVGVASYEEQAYPYDLHVTSAAPCPPC